MLNDGSKAARKLEIRKNEPGKSAKDDQLEEAKSPPKVNHLPKVLKPECVRKLLKHSFE